MNDSPTLESDRRSDDGDLAFPELAVIVSARAAVALLLRTMNVVRVNATSVLMIVLKSAKDFSALRKIYTS